MLKSYAAPESFISSAIRPLIQILADMGPKANAAAEHLDKIGSDPAQPKERRVAAKNALGRIVMSKTKP